MESTASDLKLYCTKGVYVKSPALVPTQFPESSSHRQSERLKGDVDGLAGLHRLEQHKLQLEAGCALSVEAQESAAAGTKSSEANPCQAQSKHQTATRNTDANSLGKRASCCCDLSRTSQLMQTRADEATWPSTHQT